MNNPRTMRDWFLRGGERPSMEAEEPKASGSAPKAPVACQNCGGDNLADEEQCTHCGAPLQSGTTTGEYCGSTPSSSDQKTYLVKVSQVKKCLWEGYVEVQADSKLEAIAKARDEYYDNCGPDTWDLVDPDLGSDDDEVPVFCIAEPEA